MKLVIKDSVRTGFYFWDECGTGGAKVSFFGLLVAFGAGRVGLDAFGVRDEMMAARAREVMVSSWLEGLGAGVGVQDWQLWLH